MPRAIVSALEKESIEPVAWAYADLTCDGTLEGSGHSTANTYLVLSATELVLLSSKTTSSVKTYNGYFEKRVRAKAATLPEVVDSIRRLSLADISSPKVENLVSGGCLLVTVNDAERILCVFSGQYVHPMTAFCRELERATKKDDTDGAKGPEHDPHANAHEEETRCPKCGMLYPERDRKICPRCMDKKSIFLRVLKYFAPYKGRIAIMMLAVLAGTAMTLVLPYISGTVLFDNVLAKDEAASAFLESLGIPGQFVTALWILAAALLLSKLLQTLFSIIQGRTVASVVPRVMKSIQTSIFDSLGRLSISFFSRRQTGGLMTRITGDANEVMGFFIDGLPYIFTHAAYIICSMVIMFTISWELSLISLVLIPALFTVGFMMMPTLWHYYGKRHRANRSMNARINDNLTGARVVKAFGREQEEIARFDKINSRVRRSELDLVDFDNKYLALFTVVEQLAHLAVWLVGSILLLGPEQGITYGVLVTFVGYVTGLSNPLDLMSDAMRWWTDSMNSAQRIFEILDAVPEVTERENAIELKDIKGKVELEGVSFSYEPNKPVLKNVSLVAQPGSMLGIVGHSGAGKSTIVNLISRLYDCNEGRILIDGIDVRDVTFASLRKSIAMVSQETYIFMGTVEQNIAYARPDATSAEILAAAKAASAHEFIMRMPDGYNTVIGAGGRSLSGGERQRISIARAILADPRILILDEATASVDTQTERSIQDAIDKLIVGRTTISIAHRLSTLRAADSLVVIEHGEVVERGTHAELARAKGVYFKLLQLQSKALALKGISDTPKDS